MLRLTYDPTSRPLWTLRAPVEVRGRHVRQSSGPGAYADILLRLEPYAGPESVRFVDEAIDDCNEGEEFRDYVPAVRQGIAEMLNEMATEGTAIGQVQITLTLLRFHWVDSRESAYRTAAMNAMREALVPDNLVELET